MCAFTFPVGTICIASLISYSVFIYTASLSLCISWNVAIDQPLNIQLTFPHILIPQIWKCLNALPSPSPVKSFLNFQESFLFLALFPTESLISLIRPSPQLSPYLFSAQTQTGASDSFSMIRKKKKKKSQCIMNIQILMKAILESQQYQYFKTYSKHPCSSVLSYWIFHGLWNFDPSFFSLSQISILFLSPPPREQ